MVKVTLKRWRGYVGGLGQWYLYRDRAAAQPFLKNWGCQSSIIPALFLSLSLPTLLPPMFLSTSFALSFRPTLPLFFPLFLSLPALSFFRDSTPWSQLWSLRSTASFQVVPGRARAINSFCAFRCEKQASVEWWQQSWRGLPIMNFNY